MEEKKLSEIQISPMVATLVIGGLIVVVALILFTKSPYYKNLNKSESVCNKYFVAQFSSPSGKEAAFLSHQYCKDERGYTAFLRLPPKPSMLGGNLDMMTFTYKDKLEKTERPPGVGVHWVDNNTIRVGTNDNVEIEGANEKNRSLVVIMAENLLAEADYDSGDYNNTGKNQHYKGLADIESSFSNLKKLEVASTPVGNVEIFYNPSVTKVLSDKEAIEGRQIRTRLEGNFKQEYFIIYDEGPSMDPGFFIKRIDKEGETQVGAVAGTKIMIPGNGSVYVTGHTNDMVMSRNKFVLKEGKLRYVKQPYEYIGMVSKSVATVKLYESKDYKNIVAIIPRGRKIEIVLRDGDHYLIKSPFGLIGWTNIERGYQSPISGMYYAGD